MQIAAENGLEFLDLKLKMNENSKITVDVFSKPTNSFTYVMPSTCYPSNNINNEPRAIAFLPETFKILGWCPAGSALPHGEKVPL